MEVMGLNPADRVATRLDGWVADWWGPALEKEFFAISFELFNVATFFLFTRLAGAACY
jgi:hypothetical protein